MLAVGSDLATLIKDSIQAGSQVAGLDASSQGVSYEAQLLCNVFRGDTQALGLARALALTLMERSSIPSRESLAKELDETVRKHKPRYSMIRMSAHSHVPYHEEWWNNGELRRYAEDITGQEQEMLAYLAKSDQKAQTPRKAPLRDIPNLEGFAGNAILLAASGAFPNTHAYLFMKPCESEDDFLLRAGSWLGMLFEESLIRHGWTLRRIPEIDVFGTKMTYPEAMYAIAESPVEHLTCLGTAAKILEMNSVQTLN